MLLDVIFDSLRFLDRDDLDACQLVSKSLRNFIEGSATLPLRLIYCVDVGYSNDRHEMRIMHRANDVAVEPWQDATLAGDAGSLAHLRNAFIEWMTLMEGAERCVPLLSGVSGALNFKVGRLRYWENVQETATLHRSVDWIVRDLRVTEYMLSLYDHFGDDHMRALLPSTLAHDSVRATSEYLYALVRSRARTTAINNRLFDLLFDAPKLTAVLRFNFSWNGTHFAKEFIRRFIAADDVSQVARNISILKRVNLHDNLPEMCVAPRQRNVDAPKTRLLDEMHLDVRYDVQKGDLFVFKNNASGRALQLFATTARALHRTLENNVKDFFVITLITA